MTDAANRSQKPAYWSAFLGGSMVSTPLATGGGGAAAPAVAVIAAPQFGQKRSAAAACAPHVEQNMVASPFADWYHSMLDLRRNSLSKLTQRLTFVLFFITIAGFAAQNGKTGKAAVNPDDLKTYLTYLSSDELEGRATFSEGLGIAAGYIAGRLQEWGIKPGGDHGSYFQRVAVLGVKATRHSYLTVEVNGQTKTFKDGEGVTFPANAGGKRDVVVDNVEFLGYGLNAPQAHINDYAGKDVKGKAVVYLGTLGPKDFPAALRRNLAARGSSAIEDGGAAATIGVSGFGFGGGGRGAQAAGAPTTGAPGAAPAAQGGGGGGGGFGGRGTPLEAPDFTTVQRLDRKFPPSVTAQDALFEFLFSNAPMKYAELKDKAAKQEVLPGFSLSGVKVTFHMEADYRIVRTQFTRNVVGVIEGSDAKLKDTYVTFGAHYDHVGYAEGEIVQGANGPARTGPSPGRVKPGAIEDRIWNGADDDGSGTATLLGVAKAFAKGPRMKRSLAFFWHSGEERGLYGSRYNADYPAIPIEKTAANLNMDMVGRNRDDKPEEENTVYVVGSDRISSELHEILQAANDNMPKPMKLDFEFNDPTDPERIYTRSDHYSYAAQGIPIAFFTTGLHPDYHFNTDSVEKINFEKMARIGELVYQTGRRVAVLDHFPSRDNKGARAGIGASGAAKQ